MFYCPIHHTIKYKETNIDCIVDTITYWRCEECEKISSMVDPIDKWFHNSNEKLDKSLKQLVRNKEIAHYHVSPFIKQNLEHYTCYKYLDQSLIKISIYNHLFGRSLSIQTPRKTRYKDLPNEGSFPIELAKDNNLLRQILKLS